MGDAFYKGVFFWESIGKERERETQMKRERHVSFIHFSLTHSTYRRKGGEEGGEGVSLVFHFSFLDVMEKTHHGEMRV